MNTPVSEMNVTQLMALTPKDVDALSIDDLVIYNQQLAVAQDAIRAKRNYANAVCSVKLEKKRAEDILRAAGFREGSVEVTAALPNARGVKG